MNPSWVVTPEKIETAVQKIVEFEQPQRVILFGSAAHGTTNINSDLDILVVTKKETPKPREESVRIRRALRGLSMAMDIIVISERLLREIGNQPGLIYREALRHGKVVYEATS